MGNEATLLSGVDDLEIMERKTALSADDAWYFSEHQLGPTVGIHMFHRYHCGANIPHDISA